MEKDEIFEKVQEKIAEVLEIPEEKILISSNLAADLEAESLDLVDLVVALEEEFGVEVPDEEVADIQTVSDIVEFISSKS